MQSFTNGMEERFKFSLYVRNFIFGVEDSLVSTVGLLSGIATSQVPHATILLTGFIYVFVEAFSMAVGSFLSEDSAQEYMAKSEVSDRLPVAGSVIMFVSFLVAGFIPIFPYLIWSGVLALYASVGFSLATLFALGFINGKLSRIKPWRRAIRMAILGGLAIGIGVIVGEFFKI